MKTIKDLQNEGINENSVCPKCNKKLKKLNSIFCNPIKNECYPAYTCNNKECTNLDFIPGDKKLTKKEIESFKS